MSRQPLRGAFRLLRALQLSRPPASHESIVRQRRNPSALFPGERKGQTAAAGGRAQGKIGIQGRGLRGSGQRERQTMKINRSYEQGSEFKARQGRFDFAAMAEAVCEACRIAKDVVKNGLYDWWQKARTKAPKVAKWEQLVLVFQTQTIGAMHYA